jgi:hypothetical protein
MEKSNSEAKEDLYWKQLIDSKYNDLNNPFKSWEEFYITIHNYNTNGHDILFKIIDICSFHIWNNRYFIYLDMNGYLSSSFDLDLKHLGIFKCIKQHKYSSNRIINFNKILCLTEDSILYCLSFSTLKFFTKVQIANDVRQFDINDKSLIYCNQESELFISYDYVKFQKLAENCKYAIFTKSENILYIDMENNIVKYCKESNEFIKIYEVLEINNLLKDLINKGDSYNKNNTEDDNDKIRRNYEVDFIDSRLEDDDEFVKIQCSDYTISLLSQKGYVYIMNCMSFHPIGKR